VRNRTKPIIAWVLFGLILVPSGIHFLGEATRFREMKKLPVVRGIVVDRFKTNITWFAKRPVLIIQIENTNVKVEAVLGQNGFFDFPREVSVHYSGDPTVEILVVGEDDPLLVALFFLLMPVVIPLLILGIGWFSRKWKAA